MILKNGKNLKVIIQKYFQGCINFGVKKCQSFKNCKLIYSKFMKVFCLIFFLIFISNPVYAYIGPGLGIGLVLSIIGLIFSVFLFILALLWLPFKKLLYKNKKKIDDKNTK